MPVARATGFYLTKHPPFSCSSPPSRSDGGEGRERGLCRLSNDWFWCVPDRDDGFMPMFDDPWSGEVTTSREPCDRVTHPTGLL